jgi:hypothetical protein
MRTDDSHERVLRNPVDVKLIAIRVEFVLASRGGILRHRRHSKLNRKCATRRNAFFADLANRALEADKIWLFTQKYQIIIIIIIIGGIRIYTLYYVGCLNKNLTNCASNEFNA